MSHRRRGGGAGAAAGWLALVLLVAGHDPARSGEASGAASMVAAELARADSAYAEGREDDARVAYQSVLSLEPRSARACHRLAVLLSHVDRLDSALVWVGRARSLEPRDPGVLVTEARLLSWAGRLDASIAAYDTLLGLDPGHHEARLGRALVLGWAGRYVSADSMYASMLAVDPQDVEAMTGRAQNAAWSGRLSFAEAQYLAATQLDRDNVDALLGLARLHHGQGRQRAAAGDVSRALALDRTSHAASALHREIRAAQRPQVDLGFNFSHDSDENVVWSRTFSTWIALADGVRGFLSGGSLVASDPARDAGRTLGEVGLEASYGRMQGVVATGTRRLDPRIGPGRSAPSYRSSLSVRPLARFSAGVGVAHLALDETAALIGSGLDADEYEASVDAEIGRRNALSATGAGARISDGNHRASGLVALTHSLGRLGSVGVLARALSYARRGVGYFSPDRFALAEARTTLALTRGPCTVRLNGGLGAQEVGAGASKQLAWRAAGQVRYGWGVINHVEASFGASNSAASSTTGAFRYLTAAIGLRLGL